MRRFDMLAFGFELIFAAAMIYLGGVLLFDQHPDVVQRIGLFAVVGWKFNHIVRRTIPLYRILRAQHRIAKLYGKESTRV